MSASSKSGQNRKVLFQWIGLTILGFICSFLLVKQAQVLHYHLFHPVSFGLSGLTFFLLSLLASFLWSESSHEMLRRACAIFALVIAISLILSLAAIVLVVSREEIRAMELLGAIPVSLAVGGGYVLSPPIAFSISLALFLLWRRNHDARRASRSQREFHKDMPRDIGVIQASPASTLPLQMKRPTAGVEQHRTAKHGLRRCSICLAIVPVLAALLTLVFLPQDAFLGDWHWMPVNLLLIAVVLLLLVISTATAAIGFWLTRARQWSRIAWALTLVLGLSVVGSAAAVYCRDLYRIHDAKSYLEGKIRQLEAYKAASGAYPLSIEQVVKQEEDPPYLIANHDGFSSCSDADARNRSRRWYCPLNDGAGFELSFGYCQGFDERPSYYYTSHRRYWRCGGSGCLTDHD